MKPYETRILPNQTIEINGQLVTVALKLDLYFDESFELDWDFQPGEKEALERKIERGDLTPTGIVVAAYAEGESGNDTCWGFLVSQPSDITDALKDHGFEANAIAELKRVIQDKAKRLAKYA